MWSMQDSGFVRDPIPAVAKYEGHVSSDNGEDGAEDISVPLQNDAAAKHVEALRLRKEVLALNSDLAALEAALQAELDVEVDIADDPQSNNIQTQAQHARRSAQVADKRSKLFVEHHRVPSESNMFKADSLSRAGTQKQTSVSRHRSSSSDMNLDLSSTGVEQGSTLVFEHHAVAAIQEQLQATSSDGNLEALHNGGISSSTDVFGQISLDTRVDVGVDASFFNDGNTDDIEPHWHITTPSTCESEELSPVELACMCDPFFEKLHCNGSTDEKIASIQNDTCLDIGNGNIVARPLNGSSISAGISTEAHQFLMKLMAGSGGLEGTRDAILQLLTQSLRKDGTSAEFQAAGLIEVFRDPCGEPPDAQHVRSALSYLFKHAPQRNQDALVLAGGMDTEIELRRVEDT